MHSLQPGDLADACGLGLGHFRRLFKTTFGCSPRAWLAEQRIRHAADLLRESDISVDDLAQACGYESTPAFTRCFKRIMGQAPGQWRLWSQNVVTDREPCAARRRGRGRAGA
ncbi:MAG: helix-turn-helix transcriptional regulator [Planctomycetota bacterium]